MKQFLCVTILFCVMFSGHSQNSTEDLFLRLDQAQGYENLSILNGVAYKPQYRTINEKHSFYGDGDFYSGTLDYDGQEFSNIKLRYDMFTEEVVVNVQGTREEQYIYKLIPKLLTGFIIDDRKFEKLSFSNAEFNSGFYEALYELEDITIYKKQNLRPYEKRDRSVAYYEFEKTSIDYLLKRGNKFYEISRSDLEDLYSSHQKEISDYFKTNRATRKGNYENFLRGLARLIQDIEIDIKSQD